MDLQASLRKLTIVAGGSETVGPGGYLTGGGHGALSATYGMGADQVLEMEIVTPRGEILTINECQNQDLFWAMRGVSLISLDTIKIGGLSLNYSK
jgi:FAD/FMN-containing dehydrogenase